ncbi:hypothetical protein F511_12531 [Dorcoceras hygrometricum]|uniref:Uncharacterized protein n=1 Tax=Dorcoceras hygrometricum TaxID=472368 RepID=A0A2Z7DF10_9LAMI|nr:hypothetical protein F511_12531 [Dorcoceras hygrometricum]
MASAAAGRGTQAMQFMPIMRKAYHGKTGSPELVSDTAKLNINGVELKNNVPEPAGKDDASWWIRDDRTGIFYPKGQEKVIEDVPTLGEGKEFGSINWFG